MKEKRSYFKESIFATAFVLLSLLGLSQIQFNSDVVNPISKTLADFRLTDIVFSQLRERPACDSNVVLVNLGPYTRERSDLARMVNILNHYKPKVIGIDAFFRKSKGDSVDAPLVDAFSKANKIILVSDMKENQDANVKICDSMDTSHSKFMKYAEPGFADMITKSKDHFKTSRECPVVEWTHRKGKTDTMYYSFPLKIASVFAPEKAKKFVDRGNDFEIINFRGNIDTRLQDVAENSKIAFPTLDWTDVEDTLFVPELIKDKIVIIGYLGDFLGDNAWEDKFFTPLNANYVGKANPDMYGVVVHANVVSMILNEDYINTMPEWINWILTLIFVFLNVWFFSYLYFRTEMWFDGLSTLITLAEIIVLMFIVIMVFDRYDYIVDITVASVALFLTGNLIEIHYGILKPSVVKIGSKLPFLKKI